MENNKRIKLDKNTTYFDLIKSNNATYINSKKIVVSDCDGVLTDGNSVYDKTGKCQKIFGAYDTEMISFMHSQGWEFIFVSRDPSGIDITKARIKDMNCSFEAMSGEERANLVNKLLKTHEIVLFVGDSLSDIPSMSNATYSACTNNAVEQCKLYCDYISELNGGHGALSEILLWIHNKLK